MVQLQLLTGATLVVAAPSVHREPDALAALIRSESVTVVHFVPSMLAAFLDEPAAAGCTTLRQVICSGEALPPALADRFHAIHPARLDTLYGPTEAAIDVSSHLCTAGEAGRVRSVTRCARGPESHSQLASCGRASAASSSSPSSFDGASSAAPFERKAWASRAVSSGSSSIGMCPPSG